MDTTNERSRYSNQWTSVEIDNLLKLKYYHFQSVSFIEKLLQNGRAFLESNQIPKRPELDTIDKIITIKKPKLKNDILELQANLESFLLNPNVQTLEGNFIEWDRILSQHSGDIHKILPSVIETLKHKNCLGDHLKLGELLNTEFQRFQLDKQKGKISKSLHWSKFIEQFMSSAHDRRYRKVYKALKNHQKFYQLHCSFDFILKHISQIEIMLTDFEYSNKWS